MKLKMIVTRFPNLECGFFAAMCEIVRVREHLGITLGNLEWHFVSTFQGSQGDIPEGDDVVSFNAGGGQWDQHGHVENQSLCQKCSLDLVRGDYDFLRYRPWLRQIYAIIRANDLTGERISNHPYSLRELMNGLTVCRQAEPQLVLEWLALAFWGAFTRVKAEVEVANVFDPEELVKGVEEYAPDRLEWFRGLLNESVATLEKQWSWAKSAVGQAVKAGCTAEVFVPAVGGKVRIVSVSADSIKTASAARRAGYHVCIQWTKAGHCQIHGGLVFVKDTAGQVVGKLKLDMGAVAERVRLEEAYLTGFAFASDVDWQGSGLVRDIDGDPVPWYLPEYRTSLYNGTLSSTDVPPTAIPKGIMMGWVCDALPRCQLVVSSDPLPEGAVVAEAPKARMVQKPDVKAGAGNLSATVLADAFDKLGQSVSPDPKQSSPIREAICQE